MANSNAFSNFALSVEMLHCCYNIHINFRFLCITIAAHLANTIEFSCKSRVNMRRSMTMTLLYIIPHFCILMLLVRVAGGNTYEHAWREKSLRYTGFRFEIGVENDDFDFKALIQSRADTNFCFGWAQDSPRSTIVGEVRCKTKAGQKMIDFVSALADKVNIRIYEDSLIRLHFAGFNILPRGRNTCFREEPHKCDHLFFQGKDGTPLHERGLPRY